MKNASIAGREFRCLLDRLREVRPVKPTETPSLCQPHNGFGQQGCLFDALRLASAAAGTVSRLPRKVGRSHDCPDLGEVVRLVPGLELYPTPESEPGSRRRVWRPEHLRIVLPKH